MTAPALIVLGAGLQTTIQDLGRPGLMRFGVAPGGALDRRALILGNRLVGNDAGAAALEITLVGSHLLASSPLVAALTGADLGATLNGASLPRWEPFLVGDGDEIVFQPGDAGTTGVRAYLCIAGGIAVEPVLGSRSTDLFGGFGGWDGRPLRAGDRLPVGEPAAPFNALMRRRLAGPHPVSDPAAPIRVVLGPQLDRFTYEGIAAFLGDRFAVAPRSDRTGLRLDGPPVAHARGADLVSEGIGHGAVQVPGDGRPIVLLAARQTIGGYPKIATAIGADLDRLGQLRPGDPVRFEAVDVATARSLTLAARAALGSATVTTRPSTPGIDASRLPPRPPVAEDDLESQAVAWTPDAIAALAAALRDAEVSSFRLEIGSLGLRLEFDWVTGSRGADTGNEDGGLPQHTAPPDPGGAEAADEVVTAPVLGVFYRRSAPDRPPLVVEGELVEAGQPLGLLEVMKTYHEVTAPRAARVAAFLVEDGDFVEYGRPIVRLSPPAAGDQRARSGGVSTGVTVVES